MSDDTDLELRFGADASAVGPAANEVKSQVGAIADSIAALSAGMKAMGASAVAAFNESAVAAKETAVAVKETANQVKEFREMISGIGEAVMAAFAVEAIAEFVSKMGEASEKTLHTAQIFGLTVGEVQKMNAQAALFGVPAEAMTTAMQRLDKSFATAKEGGAAQSAAFKELGINIQGSYTQTQLMSAALEGLSKMDAGPAKVAAAMQLFGRNIQAIGPLLGLTNEQLEEANKTVDDYGAVNENAAMKGAALGESLNVTKVAGMGLNNVFTDALAPSFKVIVDGINELTKGFIQSYNSGGAAKTVMDALSWSVKELADLVAFTGLLVDVTFKLVLGAAEALAYGFGAAFDIVGGAVNAIIDAFQTFGKVALDALTLNWGAIAGDIKSGIARVSADVVSSAKQMGADAAEGFKKGGDEWMSAGKDGASYEAWSKKLWGADGAAAPKGPKEGTGTTAQDPGKQKKAAGAAGGDDELQQWEQQLQDKKLADNNFWNDDLAGEIAFWQQKLAHLQAETGGTKAEMTKRAEEIRTIRQKIFDDQKTLAQQQREQALADAAAQTKIAVDAADAQYKATKDGLDAKVNAVKTAAKDGQMGPAAELAALEALNDQEVAATLQKINAISAAEMAGLKAREAIYADDPKNLKKTQDAEVALTASTQAQITAANADGLKTRSKLEDDAARQVEQIWQQRIGGIVSAFGSGVEGMVNGTKTFQQAMLSVASSIESSIFRAIESMVTKWIAGELAKTTMSQGQSMLRQGIQSVESLFGISTGKAAALANVNASAAAAGAAGVASAAAIPVVGWAMAPGAGATDSGAAMAYLGMASAAGGYDIPTGVFPMTQLHEEEMVLPASLANPFRAMAANFNAPSAANDSGDTHNHNYGDTHIHALDGNGVYRAISNNKDDFAKAVGEVVRAGKGPRMGLATS